jgi:hypothetical protein
VLFCLKNQECSGDVLGIFIFKNVLKFCVLSLYLFFNLMKDENRGCNVEESRRRSNIVVLHLFRLIVPWSTLEYSQKASGRCQEGIPHMNFDILGNGMYPRNILATYIPTYIPFDWLYHDRLDYSNIARTNPTHPWLLSSSSTVLNG